MSTTQILGQARAYAGLASKSRVRAYVAVSESPGIGFNDLARKIHMKKELLAYHLGVLKAAGLVELRYQRKSKKTSCYYPTKEGKRLVRLISKRP